MRRRESEKSSKSVAWRKRQRKPSPFSLCTSIRSRVAFSRLSLLLSPSSRLPRSLTIDEWLIQRTEQFSVYFLQSNYDGRAWLVLTDYTELEGVRDLRVSRSWQYPQVGFAHCTTVTRKGTCILFLGMLDFELAGTCFDAWPQTALTCFPEHALREKPKSLLTLLTARD